MALIAASAALLINNCRVNYHREKTLVVRDVFLAKVINVLYS